LGDLLLLTGPPRSGKTTVVKRLVERLRSRGIKAGGMMTSETSESGVRTGFEISDISTGRVGVLASTSGGPGPRVGKYTVSLVDLEDVGVGAIERALSDSEIIVIDEVGPMELTSRAFVNAVEKALVSVKPLVMTVHWRANHPLLGRVRREGSRALYEVTPESREALPAVLEGHMLGLLAKHEN